MIDKSSKELEKLVLEKRGEGKLVVATFEGYMFADVKRFIKQPIDGILYDLNRLEETTLTFIDKPEYGIKWVNDFAVALTIRELKSSVVKLEVDNKIYQDGLHKIASMPTVQHIMYAIRVAKNALKLGKASK